MPTFRSFNAARKSNKRYLDCTAEPSALEGSWIRTAREPFARFMRFRSLRSDKPPSTSLPETAIHTNVGEIPHMGWLAGGLSNLARHSFSSSCFAGYEGSFSGSGFSREFE